MTKTKDCRENEMFFLSSSLRTPDRSLLGDLWTPRNRLSQHLPCLLWDTRLLFTYVCRLLTRLLHESRGLVLLTVDPQCLGRCLTHIVAQWSSLNCLKLCGLPVCDFICFLLSFYFYLLVRALCISRMLALCFWFLKRHLPKQMLQTFDDGSMHM